MTGGPRKNGVRAIAAAAVAAGLALPATGAARPGEARESFRVMLNEDSFLPGRLDAAGLQAALDGIRAGQAAPGAGAAAHALLQLESPASATDRAALEARGVAFLAYVPHDTWIVGVSPAARAADLVSRVRWLAPMASDWKIAPRLRANGAASWTALEDGRHRFIVKFMPDVPLAAGRARLEAAGAGILREIRVSHGFEAALPAAGVAALAAFDEVLRVSDSPPPKQEENDGSRANAGAEAIQAAPYGLSGAGVMLGIWDSGNIDATHDDFAGRVIVRDSLGVSAHGTHVAGTMMGSGALSALRGGSAFQWRGMAPQAQILSYDWNEHLEEHDEAVDAYALDIGSNSWGYTIGDFLGNCDTYGDYSDGSPELDDIVRGFYGKPVTVVFSAGNERDDGDCGIDARGGFACIGPLKTAKNVITVGAIESDTDGMTEFSSWGPIDDGRIKPDLVAPGCEAGGEGFIHSTLTGDQYGGDGWCGTSMAAPVVSGCAALLTELWRDTYPPAGGPLPSTLKALMLGTVRDLGNPGPDYVFGYGALDAKAAADLVLGAGARVDSIGTAETHSIAFMVPSGGLPDTLRLALVWDDAPGLELANPALVNDLDLVLEDPDGGLHRPWVLDPLNPVTPAATGEDRLNNVEVVRVVSPAPGLWEARVSGFNVPLGPQVYSLVGIDTAPPAAVSGFDARSLAPNQAEVSWTNPASADFAGTLVVRSAAPIVWTPVDGVLYLPGQEVAPGVFVRSVDGANHSGTPVVDPGLDGGLVYRYGAASFDRRGNYAAMVTDAVSVAGPVLPRVTGVDPEGYAVHVTAAGAVTVTFSAALDSATVDSLSARLVGAWSGERESVLALGGGGGTLTLTPSAAFLPGEEVRVRLANALEDAAGSALPGGFQSSYVAAAGGNGGGEFTQSAQRSAGANPLEIACGDFDGDGLADVANVAGSELRVYRNLGTGALAAPVVLPAGVEPVGLAAGDLDADGDLDLVAANRGDSTYRVYLGTGAGAFAAQPAVPLPGAPEDVVLGDWNGDGHLDAAFTLGAGRSVASVAGAGDGAFGAAVQAAVPGAVASLAALDLHGDGRLDLAASDAAGGRIHLLVNDGAGRFAGGAALTAGAGVADLAAADFDGDGRADLAAVDRIDNTLSVHPGVPGGFAAPARYAVGTQPWTVAAADVDRDGDLDLLVSVRTSGKIVLLRNQGDGSFAAAQDVGVANQPRGLAPLDLDGDADLDYVVVRGLVSAQVLCFRNETLTDVAELPRGPSDGVRILGAAPHPLRGGAARLAFELPREGPVRLTLYDSLGRLVRRVADGEFAAGAHAVEWNGRDERGRDVAPGIYFLRLQAAGVETAQKLTIVR